MLAAWRPRRAHARALGVLLPSAVQSTTLTRFFSPGLSQVTSSVSSFQ